jgi:hypothetical protein
MNAAEMDKAFDARGCLARIGAMNRRHSVVVAGMHALRLNGTTPGHRPPGDRAQRKGRGEYRADETSNAVFHRDECCREVTGWQGEAGLPRAGEVVVKSWPTLPASPLPRFPSDSLRLQRNPS